MTNEELAIKIDNLSDIVANLAKTMDERFKQINKRFEKVDERFEQINHRFELIDERFEQVDERFEQIDRRFKQVDERFEQIDRRFKQVDERFEQINHRFELIDERFEQINERFRQVDERFEQIDEQLADIRKDHKTLVDIVKDMDLAADERFQELKAGQAELAANQESLRADLAVVRRELYHESGSREMVDDTLYNSLDKRLRRVEAKFPDLASSQAA